ncbi:DUF2225 domain-containing protein [Desulfofundulus sp.]|uniref:DUF2225 domain-containing protein n=1 Tax=Desulfofundulus sp. TaxID=2282750 RepID=UPI003C78014A
MPGTKIIQSLAAGEFLFREGEHKREMYVVLQGRIELSKAAGGHREVQAFVGPGELIDCNSLLEGLSQQIDARAMEDSLVLVINEDNLEQVIKMHPQLAAKITRALRDKPPAQKETLCAGSGHRFLYQSEIKCPVCSTTFTVCKVFQYKLSVTGQDSDFRQRYRDFEPLLYSIWVCPACFYANQCTDFPNLSARQKKLLQDGKAERQKVFSGTMATPGTLEFALLAHRLALFNSEQMAAEPDKIARLWLHLAWLYEDGGQKKAALDARARALEYSQRAYFNSSRKLSTKQEQQLAYLIGELHFRLGQYAEALDFFRRAVVVRGGSAALNEQARDMIALTKKWLNQPANLPPVHPAQKKRVVRGEQIL